LLKQTLSELRNRYQEMNSEYSTDCAFRDKYEADLESVNNQIADLNIEELKECALVLQKMSAHQREFTRKSLEDLGTMALQYSLGPDYKMVLEISETKKKPSASMYILHLPTLLKTNPVDSNGGGVIDIISAAMRFVIIQTYSNPMIDGPIIMDEPFKMVSENFIPVLTEFIKKTASEFGRQVIMVTHNNYLAETCEQIITVARDENKNESVIS